MIISTLSLNSISVTPLLSETNTTELKYKANNLDTNYFNKIPVNDYIIGSGDTLRISISREYPELLTSATVDGEGTIYLPRTSRIFVKGLSIKELNNLLNQKYKEFVKFPKVEVEVTSYRPIKVLLNGEVANPGVKTLEGSISLQNQTEDPALPSLGTSQSTSNIDQGIDPNILELLGNNNLNKGQMDPEYTLRQYRSTTNYYFPTVIDAIRESGGLTEYSDLKSVLLSRKNQI